jgi:2-polyprenyl-3-methyl-5-hydroxy-6-metoxy-1,4-benzoquinol methylase
LSRDLAGGYQDKDPGYFDNPRADYIQDLPDNPQARILELGCGAGATGALALSRGKCGAYVGVELVPEQAALAADRLTAVHVGAIEDVDLPYAPGSFDALICSEVLEHLVDPEAVVARLVRLLRPGGLVFASSPNISHHLIIRSLIFGRFDYADQGVMDRTHLRWFTPRSFRRLFEGAGVAVDRLAPINQRALLPRLAGRGPLSHLTWAQIDLRGRRLP